MPHHTTQCFPTSSPLDSLSQNLCSVLLLCFTGSVGCRRSKNKTHCRLLNSDGKIPKNGRRIHFPHSLLQWFIYNIHWVLKTMILCLLTLLKFTTMIAKNVDSTKQSESMKNLSLCTLCIASLLGKSSKQLLMAYLFNSQQQCNTSITEA